MTDPLSNEDNPETDPIEVCFTVLQAYPAIDSSSTGPIGGMETRSWLMARTLAKLSDFQVEFLVRVPRPVSRHEVEGVRIHAVRDRFSEIRRHVSANVSRSSKFPWLRFRKFSPSLLWQIPLLACYESFRPRTHATHDCQQPLSVYTQFRADVLVTFGVNVVSAAVVASAQASGKKSVLCLAHDDDLDERYRSDSEYVNAYNDPAPACYFAIDQCDEVLVQTKEQQELLRQRFGRTGTLIENPIDLQEWDAQLQSNDGPAVDDEEQYVLWVGRAERTQKRPQLMPELARLCPELKFLMVMNPGDPELRRQIERDAPANLQIQDPVPFPEMPGLFRRALALVNTSASEGFPNTFLQAATSGVPVVSLEVGGSFLRDSKSGDCAEGSMEVMANLVRQTVAHRQDAADPEVRNYLEQHHGLAGQVEKFANLLRRIAR